MARIGMNPGRGKRSSYSPARVTAAVLVHIPHFAGYFEHRLEVLEVCLASLLRNTSIPLDLLVFDNASCDEVQHYLGRLQQQGLIQFLLRSHSNLGKVGALQMIFRAAPGEIVAYCDDDFYFFPGWLEAQLTVLDAYPNVGMVSGYTIPSLFAMDRISATIDFAKGNSEARLLEGKFIPEEWIRDWAISTGREPDEALDQAQPLPEYLVEYRGVPAFATANHDQFIAPREIIQSCLQTGWSGRLMGEMLELDRAVNQAGYLRLTTRERTTQHLGNQLSAVAVTSPGLTLKTLASQAHQHRQAAWWKRVVRWPPVRSSLLVVYSKLFRLVHPD